MEITEKIIDGKSVSKQIIEEVKQNTIKAGVKPGLALILVGNDPASEVYVRNKGRVCEEIGFYSVTEKLPETTPEKDRYIRKSSAVLLWRDTASVYKWYGVKCKNCGEN